MGLEVRDLREARRGYSVRWKQAAVTAAEGRHHWYQRQAHRRDRDSTPPWAAAGTKVTIGKPATLRALQIWNNLVNVYHAGNPHTATLNSSVPYYDFSVGKQAMTITWPWAMVQTAQEYPKIMKDVKVVPLPQVNPAHRS
ncbi:MAG: hypothetical protein M1522_04335 [Actinobacteria bacterium]|nr:hypothetical protein [Actinomycetota bacterium]